MKRRNLDAKAKVKMALERLSGRPVSEICSEYRLGRLSIIVGETSRRIMPFES